MIPASLLPSLKAGVYSFFLEAKMPELWRVTGPFEIERIPGSPDFDSGAFVNSLKSLFPDDSAVHYSQRAGCDDLYSDFTFSLFHTPDFLAVLVTYGSETYPKIVGMGIRGEGSTIDKLKQRVEELYIDLPPTK